LLALSLAQVLSCSGSKGIISALRTPSDISFIYQLSQV